MADNNNVLTIVLVVAAVLLFSGNLTGNVGRQVPAGSQVAAWCQSPEGKLIADGDYTAYSVENNHYVIETCAGGNLRRVLCSRPPLGSGQNQRIMNAQQMTTDPNSYGCDDLSISNTVFQESSF